MGGPVEAYNRTAFLSGLPSSLFLSLSPSLSVAYSSYLILLQEKEKPGLETTTECQRLASNRFYHLSNTIDGDQVGKDIFIMYIVLCNCYIYQDERRRDKTTIYNRPFPGLNGSFFFYP